ncbi:MAG: hypothetical protein ACR2O4_08840, partial [Hyphomicrobiaceae bacterium]
PGLFAYKTASHYEGLAALDGFDPDPDAEEMSFELWSNVLEPGWTDVQAFTFTDGNAGLLFVDTSGLRTALGRVRDDGQGVDVICRSEETDVVGQWNHIGRVNRLDGTVPALMGYEQDTGGTWMIAPDPTGPSPLRIGGPAGLPPGWAHIHVMERPDGLMIFGFNEESGLAQLMAAVDNEDNFLLIWDEEWRAGEMLVELMPAPSTALFIYDPATGAWEVRSLGPTGSEFAAEGAWRPGFTVLLPFTMNQKPHVLGYDAETGEVEILRLDGEEAEVVWQFRWSEGWTLQVPLFWGTRQA